MGALCLPAVFTMGRRARDVDGPVCSALGSGTFFAVLVGFSLLGLYMSTGDAHHGLPKEHTVIQDNSAASEAPVQGETMSLIEGAYNAVKRSTKKKKSAAPAPKETDFCKKKLAQAHAECQLHFWEAKDACTSNTKSEAEMRTTTKCFDARNKSMKRCQAALSLQASRCNTHLRKDAVHMEEEVDHLGSKPKDTHLLQHKNKAHKHKAHKGRKALKAHKKLKKAAKKVKALRHKIAKHKAAMHKLKKKLKKAKGKKKKKLKRKLKKAHKKLKKLKKKHKKAKAKAKKLKKKAKKGGKKKSHKTKKSHKHPKKSHKTKKSHKKGGKKSKKVPMWKEPHGVRKHHKHHKRTKRHSTKHQRKKKRGHQKKK